MKRQYTSILTNEKYKGAALLQKKFTVDFLTKKMKINEGEIPQYYVENSHEPIILPVEFDFVQNEITRRKAISGKSVFSTKLICGDCGEYFGSKVWQSNTKYRKTIWQCNSKFKGDNIYTTPHITENEIKTRFLQAYNKLVFDCEKVLDDCRLMQQTLTDCTEIDEKLAEVYRELEITAELTRKCITENSQNVMNQDEYLKKYNGYVERYEKQKTQANELEKRKQARIDKSISI